MNPKIIDGNHVKKELLAQCTEEVERLKKSGIIPGLAVILVGDNPASKAYVEKKKKVVALSKLDS